MTLTPSIESKYAQLKREQQCSEVALIMAKELITNLATIQVEAMKKEDLKKVKQAA